MNILGVGPLLALVGLIAAVSVAVLERIIGYSLSLPSYWHRWTFWVGVVLLVTGTHFWICSVALVKRAFASRQLVKTGVYGLSRHPMYAAFIVFIIPGLALASNHLLLLFISALMFIAFKMLIGKEEEFLAKEFGVEFEDYRKNVPQLIPFIHV